MKQEAGASITGSGNPGDGEEGGWMRGRQHMQNWGLSSLLEGAQKE